MRGKFMQHCVLYPVFLEYRLNQDRVGIALECGIVAVASDVVQTSLLHDPAQVGRPRNVTADHGFSMHPLIVSRQPPTARVAGIEVPVLTTQGRVEDRETSFITNLIEDGCP